MTDGEPETVVSASLQKLKSIKNPIKRFCFVFIFYFIKSETSNSFVSHFDGHFAYLKTLDFYFKSTEAISFRTPTTGQYQCSMSRYVHRDHKDYYGRGPWMAASTFPQLSESHD